MKKNFDNLLFLDLETSGLNPDKCGILSIGAAWGSSEQYFYGECYLADGLEIEKKALEINRFSLESIRDQKKRSEKKLIEDFFDWCEKLSDSRKKFLICGNNPFFDVAFLKSACERHKMDERMKNMFYSKPIDVASIFYYELMWKENIEERRSLEKMAVELNILPTGKYHDALTDATMAREILKRLLNEREKKNFFSSIFAGILNIIKEKSFSSITKK